MSRRAEHRRNGRESARRCLTVSDAHLINEMRRLPTDHPSRGMRKHKNKPRRPRMAFPIFTSPEQAWRYVRVIRASPAAQKVIRHLRQHPGPQPRCGPEVILLAIFLAAEIKGRYLRSDLCRIINGLDATILYHLGLCDNKTFKPVAYTDVEVQVLRLERTPFGRLLTDQRPHEHDDSPAGEHNDEEPDREHDEDDPDSEYKVSADAIGRMRFNMGLLLASIPKRARAKIVSASLDATAFPTYARVHDYGVQAEVDRAIRDAIKRGDPDPVPYGVIIGADGKLQRCKYDPAARTARRSASSETDHKARYFTGYFVTMLTACRNYSYNYKSFQLNYDISPYVLALSCDPASDDLAPVARELCRVLKGDLPAFRTVTADREFSPRHILVEWLHTNGIDFIMDYAWPLTKKIKSVTVGHREELLYQFCGDFFPRCIPEKFKNPPDASLSDDEIRQFFEELAKWRYIPNGPPDSNGTRQFICPQCAGHVRFAAKTRMGKYRHGKHPALSLGSPFSQEWCCNGSISIRVEELNRWQPVPWYTRAHRELYGACRNRIENTNNIVKDDGGLNKRSCRAPGVPAHSMAALALAVVSNVKFADEDPLADPPPDDVPRAELSLFCVLPAFGSNGNNGSNNTHTHDADHVNGSNGAPPRAPP